MDATWLHISDLHIQAGDAYDRDVVLRALVSSVHEFRKQGRTPDIVLATGDIASSGKKAEYDCATAFFDDLLKAAGVEKNKLFIIPGNHDVDRSLGVGLVRTLSSTEEADTYFRPGNPKPHITQKLGAFRDWYNSYFDGIRVMSQDSTCGPVEAVAVRGQKIGILPMNSSLFCADDYDHSRLWIGRRCLDRALDELHNLSADIHVAILHHPLEWLNDLERSNIKSELYLAVDFICRGHLHETEIESLLSASGNVVHCAAGAAYQTRKWPNRAMFVTLRGDRITIFPIRYEDKPRELWTLDTSIFPSEPGYALTMPLWRQEPSFGPKALECFSLARETSRSGGANVLQSAHLLIGLLKIKDGKAAEFFSSFSRDTGNSLLHPNTLCDSLVRLLKEETPERADGSVVESDAYVMARDHAKQEAIRFQSPMVDDLHLLFAVMRYPGRSVKDVLRVRKSSPGECLAYLELMHPAPKPLVESPVRDPNIRRLRG